MIRLHDVPPTEADLITMARALMREYADMPHTAPRWPSAGHDIARLPDPFVMPHGVLLVATDDGTAVGCGALLAFEPPRIAEIKRVYVRSSARGRGVGEQLVRALLDRAAARGFERARLDTAPDLAAALALYRRLGFVPIPAYRSSQLPGDPCFEYDLTTHPHAPA